MEFKSLVINNFLSYKEAIIEFKKGLYLISGWNNDKNTANASGKTSIVDALCWTLFGETPRKISVNGVINWKEQKECKCSVKIKKSNNEIMVIERSRKPNHLHIVK